MALSRALREYLKKKKKAVKTEESGITPPPPPPRLLPTWLNRVGKIILKKNKFYNLDVWFLYKVCFFLVKGAGGKSSLQREEERMLKYQRSLFPRR